LGIAWQGFDTLHILAGVPSTSTLHDLSGVKLTQRSSSSVSRREFEIEGETYHDNISVAGEGIPTKQGLEAVAAEARVCGEINYVGVVIALACFVSQVQLLSEVLSNLRRSLCSLQRRNLLLCITCLPSQRPYQHQGVQYTQLQKLQDSWPSKRVESNVKVRVYGSFVGQIPSGLHYADCIQRCVPGQ
jgi:hypothetical protein